MKVSFGGAHPYLLCSVDTDRRGLNNQLLVFLIIGTLFGGSGNVDLEMEDGPFEPAMESLAQFEISDRYRILSITAGKVRSLPNDWEPDSHFALSPIAPGIIGDELGFYGFPCWFFQGAVHIFFVFISEVDVSA